MIHTAGLGEVYHFGPKANAFRLIRDGEGTLRFVPVEVDE